MTPEQKKIMLRYSFIIFIMVLVGIALLSKQVSSCLPNDNTGRMLPTVLLKKT